jgi:hypothetical protein
MITAALLASLYLDYYRFKAEENYKAVEVLVDYHELSALAKAAGLPLGELAARFKEAGATGVVVREATLLELEESGDLVLAKGGEVDVFRQLGKDFLEELPVEKNKTYVFTGNRPVYDAVLENLKAAGKEVKTAQCGGLLAVSAVLNQKEIEKMGVGFPQKDVGAISGSGLAVVPRLREYARSSGEALELTVGALKKIPGLAMVTFNDQVIPWSNNIPLLAERLEELGTPVGTFEFYSQAGLNQLVRTMGKNVVRIHTISETDMARYNERQAVERFRLAVAERNIRALYVRLFGLDQPLPAVDRNLNYLALIKKAVEAEGCRVGQVVNLPGIPYSRAVVFLVGFGVIGGGVLAAGLLVPGVWAALLGLLGLAGWAAFLALDPLLARKSFALLAAVIYPLLGVVLVTRKEGRGLPGAVFALLKMSAVSFTGAVLLTGLLADKSFMLALDLFSGVKLAHILPLVLVPAYFLITEKRPAKRIAEIMNYPVLNKHVLAGLVLAAALVVYIIRTGNEAPQLVSGWELKMRDLLDAFLGVRPRTKEFLLGHPAMLALLYYGCDLRKIVLLIFGLIGQVSLVNTYAHIHTPLAVSLVRTLHGLWLGIAIGAAVIACLEYARRRLAKGAARGE